jgi:uncharacterized protein
VRPLDAQAVQDISRGGAILGTGGGGDPYVGTLAALRALEEAGPPLLADVDELPGEALVACAVMVGAPVPLIEKLSFGPELVTAFEALTGALGRPPAALMPIEAGGVNGVLSLALGSRVGLPVVDADGMGRAFPELDLVTLTLHGIGITPLAIADEHGNSVVIDAIDASWAERLSRPVAIVFGGIAALCGYPLTAAQLRTAGVLGTLSLSERIGGALRRAREAKGDPVAAVLEATGGHELFRGKLVDVVRRTEHGWTKGEAVVEGFGAAAGRSLTVAFQNENLVATLDTGDVLATVPDLIAIVDAETGDAITTERLRYGFRVVVLGIPCAAQWRTPAGVALAGPRHFRYELDYAPVEELAARRLVLHGGS